MRASLATCLLLLCLSVAAAGAPEWIRVFSEPATARGLLGKEVLEPSGEYHGTVRELELDLKNNRVRHAIVELREGRAAYPLHALEHSPGRSHLVLDLPQAPVRPSWETMRIVPASAFLGARYATRDGAAHGEVVDVVIDAFWGNAAFAVVALDGGLRPVPLDAFRREENAFQVLVTANALRELPAFSQQELDEHLADREFLQRNARLAHTLTPGR